jgi:uncharacterized protein YecT (DUF1311 family)
MHKLTFLAGIAAMVFCTSSSDAGGLSKAYEACLNRENTNPAWAACGADEINRQDARLNEVWAKKLGCFDRNAEPWRKLVEEQRLWLKWKDNACKFYSASDKDGGAMYGREGQVLHGPACVAGIIADRADVLAKLCDDL